MNGLVSAYRLTNDTGRRIASLKQMPSAWSDPTFLPDLLRNPGPLLLYDRLYLDRRSYEHTLDHLVGTERDALQEVVESTALALFQLIEAEDVLSSGQNDYEEVALGFTDLSNDERFRDSVEQLEGKWGSYASPNPLDFEAMNIPVLTLLRRRWSERLSVELVLLDHAERAVLHQRKSERALSHIFAPTIARLMIDLVPKFFAPVPYAGDWNSDVIRQLRENKHLHHYRKKVEKTAASAAKEYARVLKNQVLSTSGAGGDDFLSALEEELVKCQTRMFDELRDAVHTLEGRIGANAWSIAGGVITGAGAWVTTVLPPLGVALSAAGGALVLAEQTRNHLAKKRCGWAEYLEFVGSEVKRPRRLP